jgi:hypothetical protein
VTLDEAEGPERADNGLGAGGGLLGRLQDRAEFLAKGRRLTILLPGWEDLGDGRGLWARFAPLGRLAQSDVVMTANGSQEELDATARALAEACEEILVGTDEERTPLGAELPDAQQNSYTPARFDPRLGEILGIGGENDVAVVKRMLMHGGDDLALFSVAGELLRWSGAVMVKQVESAVGE